MQQIPYSDDEIARITQHFVSAYTAMQAGEHTETLGKFGLPPVYANLATGLYRSTLEQNGIELRGEDLVLMGLTYGFALGRDFGRSESLDKLVEGVMSSE